MTVLPRYLDLGLRSLPVQAAVEGGTVGGQQEFGFSGGEASADDHVVDVCLARRLFHIGLAAVTGGRPVWFAFCGSGVGCGLSDRKGLLKPYGDQLFDQRPR
jgi:hypothetical protein